MATDWENYAEHMVEVMNAAPGYRNTATDGDYIPRPEDRHSQNLKLVVIVWATAYGI